MAVSSGRGVCLDRVLDGKAYTVAANRAYPRRRGIPAMIPISVDQAAAPGRRGCGVAGHRPSKRPATNSFTSSSAASACSKRNRAVAGRYDKLAVRYLATLGIAAINEWLL